jgi:cell division protein FtsL
MSHAAMPAPRVLPLARPAGEPRRLLRAMRRLLVRRALVLGAVLLGLCMLKVWLRLEVVSLGYALSAAREVQLRLEHDRQELEVEVATLRDRRRLDEIARKRLGLTDPRRGQIVELE